MIIRRSSCYRTRLRMLPIGDVMRPARDPLLRRTWATTLGPVRTQVSGHAEVSVSDCQYPWLAASSGTQRARDLLIRSKISVVQVSL
jgi:hypothetical protein